MSASPEEMELAVAQVPVQRLTAGAAQPAGTDDVIREEAVTVAIAGVGNYVLLCTPTDLEALAVGFAFSEGLLTGSACEARLQVERSGPWTRLVRLTLPGAAGAAPERNLIVSSSCGLCGAAIEHGVGGPPVGDTLRVTGAQLLAAVRAMRAQQRVFARTGGAHAAAVFAADGQLMAVAEDLGRHHALDKAVGHLLLAGHTAAGCGAALSGRLSFELVVKAARAGLEVLAAVSAPTSLAVAAAAARGITLCGFVRDDRLTVYTHPHRVREFAPQ